MQYIIEIGLSPLLGRLELQRLLLREGLKYSRIALTDSWNIIETKKPIPATIINQAGGLVRLGERINSGLEVAKVPTFIAKHLSVPATSQVEFSVGAVERSLQHKLEEISRAVKAILKNNDIKSRYILPKRDAVDPIVHRQDITEFICVSTPHGIDIFKTLSISPSLEWQKRDRGRPAIDAQSGVMPPKVARMLINIAQPLTEGEKVLFDPFCGSGTILCEALALGYTVYGSDISPKAIENSQKNLEWYSQEFQLPTAWNLALHDITTDPNTLNTPQVDAIVSEGYLGPSKFTQNDLSTIIPEVKNLYLTAMPHFKKFLKPKGSLVLALPHWRSPLSDSFHEELIDSFTRSGYTQRAKFVTYSQPDAKVQRQIYILDTK